MILEPDENGVILRVAASPPRRMFALGVVYALGALLIWLAFSEQPGLGGALFLVALGVVMFWSAERMRRATQLVLELTMDELRDSGGGVLARLDDIAKVERGPFAFKPSNGFALVVRTRGPRVWVRGMYWRLGHRLGVGGVTPARETKFMAEQIALMLAMREGA